MRLRKLAWAWATTSQVMPVAGRKQYSAAFVRTRQAQSPIRCRIGHCEIGLETALFLRRRQVRATAMRHFRRHTSGFEKPRQVFLVLLPGIFKKISIHTNTAIALPPL